MNRRGFTLIELLIVIVVIAILALIVIPKLMGASRAAKESTLKANLQQIRAAVSQYQADTGLYPLTLNDLTATAAPTNGYNSSGTSVALAPNTWKGPYLSNKGGINGAGIPQNPFCLATDVTLADHWTLGTDGSVVSGQTGTTTDGVAYSAL